MSQFISALKNSSANKRRKAEEASLAASALQTGHNNGQCCMHGDAAKDRNETTNVANVTFEERLVKDNSSLGLPAMNVKFSKVYCF